MSDTRRAIAQLMAEKLRQRGWDATTEYLAGGLWGVIVWTDDDETNVLVAQDPDDIDSGWIVSPECQQHPAYMDETLTLSWGELSVLVQEVSIAVHVLARWGSHHCEHCSVR